MKKNILIAVTVIVSLGLLVWGIEFLKGANLFKPSNYYYVKFERVDGLVTAAPVTINGFNVGLVKEMTYDYSTNKISVLLSLNKDLKLPVGSTATIKSSLTGAASLSLNLSNESKYYEVGDEIEGVRANGLMDQITGNTLPQVNNMLPKVDSILSSVNALVGNPALAASVTRLDLITQELAKSSQQLTVLMNTINTNVPGVMNNVNGITSNLSSTTTNLDEFSTQLKYVKLDSTVNNLNSTIANLQAITAKLNDKNSSLGLLLNDPTLYNNANNTVASLDSLFVDIKKNPKRYLTVKIF